jgi:STE24 endopeptidase
MRDARQVRATRPLGPSAGPRRRPALLSSIAVSVVLLAAALLVAGLVPETGPVGPPAQGEPGAALAVDAVVQALGFEEALLAEIEAYRAPRRAAALLAFVLSVAVPLVMSWALRDGRATRTLTLAGLMTGRALQAAMAASIVVLLTALARFPLALATGLVQDGRWGFRTRSTPGWLLDHLLVVGGRALAVGVMVWMVATLIVRRPRDWPARVVLVTAVIGPLALLLHPLVAHPLLLPTGAMPEGPHKEAVVAVVARSDVDVPVLLGEASRRTTRRNAVATGLGPTERIVLHDTLLELEPHEVAAIAAHELAHLERRDPLRAALAPVPFVALIALLVQRRLRTRGLPDVRALTSAAALVLALEAAATPLTAAISRTVEHRTDVRSVAISEDPAAHVTLLRTFVTDGLADPDPPRWSVLLWATHPTPTQRVLAVIGADDPATR